MHFSGASKLTAGIHFNRCIDFNGIQHKLQKKPAPSMSGGNIKGAEHLSPHSPHDCHT